jgi:hypothetical protein
MNPASGFSCSQGIVKDGTPWTEYHWELMSTQFAVLLATSMAGVGIACLGQWLSPYDPKAHRAE